MMTKLDNSAFHRAMGLAHANGTTPPQRSSRSPGGINPNRWNQAAPKLDEDLWTPHSYAVVVTHTRCTHCRATTTSSIVEHILTHPHLTASMTKARRRVPVTEITQNLPIELLRGRDLIVPICHECWNTLDQSKFPAQPPRIDEIQWANAIHAEARAVRDAAASARQRTEVVVERAAKNRPLTLDDF